MSNIEWHNETRKLCELTPWADNPAAISTAEAARLVESLRDFGQVATIAIEPDGVICDGHQRRQVWAAAQEFGPDFEVAVRVASRKLTRKEREKLAVLLRTAQGHFDWDKLAAWDTAELQGWGLDAATLAGWDDSAANLREMLAAETETPPEDAGAQVDRAEELREQWGTALGQVWEIPSKTAAGVHRLVCGDCTDRAVVEQCMQGEKAGMALADPPYGVGIDYGESTNDTRDNLRRLAESVIPLLKSCSDMVFWVSGAMVLLEWYYKTVAPDWIIAWYKGSPGHVSFVGFNDWEAVLVYGRRKGVSMHDYCNVRPSEKMGNYGHPVPKPVEWAEWFIERASESNTIVADFFAGSGTTGVACERQGRLARLIEISPAYTAVILQRLKDLGLSPVKAGQP